MRHCHILLLLLPLCLILLNGPSLAATIAPFPPHATMRERLTSSSMWLGRLQSQDALTTTRVAASTPPPGNFPFQTLTSPDGLISLHYYQQPASFASQVLTSVQQFLQQPVRDTLGFTLKHVVTIYIYNSRADFLQGAGVSDPQETGAYTLVDKSEIFLPILSAGDAGQYLPHELTHVVFHQNEDSGQLESAFFRFFPLWLDEGLAAYDEDAADSADYTYALNQAVSGHSIVDFFQEFINDYPTNVDTNYLCYAESRAFIAFLVNTYGLNKLHQFVANASDGGLQLDAETTFGLDLAQLQSHWEVTLGLPPTVKAQGYVPTITTLVPYQPGKLDAFANRTRPLALPVNAVPGGWLAVLLLVLVAAFGIYTVEWRSQQRPTTVILSPSSYSFASLTSPTSPATDSAEDVTASDGEVASLPLPVTDVATLIAPQRSHLRWYDVLLIAAPVPLVLVVGAVQTGLDPYHDYYRAYNSAALASIPLLLIALWLIIRDLRVRRVPFTRYAGVVLSLFLLISMGLLATPVGRQQARAYEAGGDYALALRYFTAMHAPASDIARVQSEWGTDASDELDYSDAATHLHAAILAAPTTPLSDKDRGQLVVAVEIWNQALINAQQFTPALRVLTDQEASSTCDTLCHARMESALAATNLVWGNDLLAGGDLAGAITQFQQAVNHAPSDAQMQSALVESQATQALQQALASGAKGDSATMNAQLRALTTRYPTTAATSEALTTPEAVTGVISDGSGAAVTNDRLILLAFTTSAAARGFTYDFNTDTTAFKIATTIGAGGKFTVRLPPGYWYVPVWDDPSQASYNDFNAPQASDNAAFTVQSLAPLTVGTIVGF